MHKLSFELETQLIKVFTCSIDMQMLLCSPKIVSFLLHHPTHTRAEDKMHKPKEFQEKFSEPAGRSVFNAAFIPFMHPAPPCLVKM